MSTPDPKAAETMLKGLKWIKTPGLGLIYARIGRAKLGQLMAAFGLPGRIPRPGYEIQFHQQGDVKFFVTNKAGRFEVDIHGDISRVIPEISSKAKVRAHLPGKSQWGTGKF